MVASVPQRRFGAAGMMVPSCGRGVRRPRARWGASSPPGAAAAARVCRGRARHAREPAEPGLCGNLAGERRIGQHPADQPHQLHIADRGRRPRPSWQLGRTDPTGVDGRAGGTQHAAHHRQWELVATAIWAASPAGSPAPFCWPLPAAPRSPWSADRSCAQPASAPDHRGCGRPAGP
jgi:hypothetical protein